MKKLLVYVLMICMVLSIGSVSVFAAEPESKETTLAEGGNSALTEDKSSEQNESVKEKKTTEQSTDQDSEQESDQDADEDGEQESDQDDDEDGEQESDQDDEDNEQGSGQDDEDNEQGSGQDADEDNEQGSGQDTEGKADENEETPEGNLTAEGDGLLLEGAGEFDILISGTLQAEGTPILIDESVEAGNVSITVWKIESPVEADQQEHVVLETAGDTGIVTEDSRKIESGILYIIKVEPTQKELIELDGTGESHGWDVARQGETVIMKVRVPNGYKLTGAYNGFGEKVLLKKNANGDYYVEVPMGGGVYLSAGFEETETEADDDEEDSDDDDEDSDDDEEESDDDEDSDSPQKYTKSSDQDACPVSDGEPFDIVFDLNGGTLHGDKGPVKIHVTSGEEVTLLEAPVKPGARFVRWKPSCPKIKVDQPGETFVAKGPVTFTAEWESDSNGRRYSGQEDDDDDDDEDDEEDSDDDKGPDVTETLLITEDSDEERNVGSITVQDDPATGIRTTASQEVDVDGAIRVTGGEKGADGIYAEATGKNVGMEVEAGSGMTVRSSSGNSCGIRAVAGKDGKLDLKFEGNVQSDGQGAVLQAEKDGKITVSIEEVK